ncbi:cysteine hydrolase [Pedobacter yulinensis]|uniref:Cysteine hydrolase n=1 Tax=Pedobacter yulinensis TaxID=2126353 RepID=A0A2T3HI13_9SPHI|nr:cysteine hydrolase family protein [Pedobacter yulinensis]PST82079.1 cysteine hydrolase [Pedobacter yulinensis]
MKITPHTALLMIDIQEAFKDIAYWGGSRNNPGAESQIAALLQAWRQASLPLFHIRHCSVSPGSPLQDGLPGNAFMEVARPLPGETVISKSANSAFIGTDLLTQLQAAGIEAVVVAGFTTDHCVSTTARMAANLGFQTTVLDDATVAFAKTGHDGKAFSAETIHDVSLASLNGEFAEITDTATLLTQLSAEQV